jgi:hypothetical protein
MRPEIFLTNAECLQHFLTIGTSGLALSSFVPSGVIDIPVEAVPPRAGPWDAIEQCIIELDWATDLRLSRSQMRNLLQETGLMAKVVEFGEVETQIRENLASEMSKSLIGEVWPTNGDIRNGVDFAQFLADFYRAADAAGFSRSAHQ